MSSANAVGPSTWDQSALARAIRHVAIIGIAGVIAGFLVAGVGGRLFMRLAAVFAPDRVGLVTENGNVVGEITIWRPFANTSRRASWRYSSSAWW